MSGRRLDYKDYGRRSRRAIKPGWLVIIGLLVATNFYLFVVRGLPGLPDEGVVPAANGASAREPGFRPVEPYFSPQGQLRGVPGVRSGAGLPDPERSGSILRFDLERAAGVAGQRLLEDWCQHQEGSLRPGDTLAAALGRVGLDASQAWQLVQALRGVLDFRRCRPGERFELWRSPRGRVERLVYHKGPLLRYLVERRQEHLQAREQREQAELRTELVDLTIHDSLYQSLAAVGERAALAMALVDIFVWDIDFYIDPRPGDRVRILVEKAYRGGRFVRYGRILAAEYAGQVGLHRAFWYEGPRVRPGYYDENGDSLRKAFLKSPLKFTQVSSGFGRRVHPVLGFSHLHLGVDLAAPRGTPIWAPADGTVVFAGRKGVNGNLVVLRHANGYQTVFAHLQHIAPDIKRGKRVSQKQFLGTVGSTGRSTGPHLHYGMKKFGRYVNPFGQKFPPAQPVPRAERERFRSTIEPLLRQLEQRPAAAASTSTALRPAREPEAG